MSKSIKEVCLIAVFAALICALSPLSFPTPLGVPVTLQTLIISVAAYLLGAKSGTAAVLCYVLLGAAGLPVFSGFTGGAAALFSATGGFIIAFPLFAPVLSFVFYVNGRAKRVLLMFAALVLLYAIGAAQFIIVTNSGVKTAVIGFAAYFVKDGIIIFLSYFLCGRIRPTLQKFIQPNR